MVIEQLIPGPLLATDSTAVIGSVLMSRIASNLPASIRVLGQAGWAAYVFLESGRSLYCNGLRCEAEHALVAGNGAELELICRAPSEVIVCRIGAKQSTLQRNGCRLVDSPIELARVRAMISSLRRPAEKCATASLRETLAALSLASCAAEGLSANRRAVSIERGRRYIHANFVGTLRIASVCEAAGIRSRTLEYGFRELFGVSPVAYIKALRLNHVRRRLLSADSVERTITTLALDSGFCHLSQFAADYQKFFGESPSVTRRRALLVTRAA